MNRSVIALLGFVVALTTLISQPATALHYTTTNLSTALAPKMGSVVATHINNSGQILLHRGNEVGVYQPDGTVIDVMNLGNGTINAIDDAGGVWGRIDTTTARYPFHWTQGSSPTDISSHGLSVIGDANSTGRILGGDYNYRAGVYDANGSLLVALSGFRTTGFGAPIGRINDNGVVVGTSDTNLPAVWHADGTMQLLTLPSGYGGASASDINNGGWTVGYVHGAADRPVVWNPDGTPTLLSLPSNASIRAKGINNNGIIVGDDGGTVYLWNTSGTLLGTVGQGFASDINDSGQIIGMTSGPTGSYAVMWTPVPEPSAAIGLLAGLGGLCTRFRRSRRSVR